MREQQVPIFTVLGNHDDRVGPCQPTFEVLGLRRLSFAQRDNHDLSAKDAHPLKGGASPGCPLGRPARGSGPAILAARPAASTPWVGWARTTTS